MANFVLKIHHFSFVVYQEILDPARWYWTVMTIHSWIWWWCCMTPGLEPAHFWSKGLASGHSRKKRLERASMKSSEETNVTFTLLALVVDSTKLEIHWNEKYPGIWFELKPIAKSHLAVHTNATYIIFPLFSYQNMSWSSYFSSSDLEVQWKAGS